MAKRNLFDELTQGFDALKAERDGKLTLKTMEVEQAKPLKITAKQIISIREKYNYSQAVFAAMLCTNVSTLRNWEQARSEPNAQAKVLLKLVDEEPALLKVLSTITLEKKSVRKKAVPKTKRKATAKKKAAA